MENDLKNLIIASMAFDFLKSHLPSSYLGAAGDGFLAHQAFLNARPGNVEKSKRDSSLG